jgi:hypothetical protein
VSALLGHRGEVAAVRGQTCGGFRGFSPDTRSVLSRVDLFLPFGRTEGPGSPAPGSRHRALTQGNPPRDYRGRTNQGSRSFQRTFSARTLTTRDWAKSMSSAMPWSIHKSTMLTTVMRVSGGRVPLAWMLSYRSLDAWQRIQPLVHSRRAGLASLPTAARSACDADSATGMQPGLQTKKRPTKPPSNQNG